MLPIGKRTQITAIVGALFTMLNAFLPELLTPEVQAAVLTVILFVAAFFFADKVERGQNRK